MKNQDDEVLDEESIKKLKEKFQFIFEPELKQKKNKTDWFDLLKAYQAIPKIKFIDCDLAVEIEGLWYTDPRILFCEIECDYNNTTECPQNMVSCVHFFLKQNEIGSRDANIPEDIFEDFTEDVTDEDLNLDNFVKDKWPGRWKKIFNGCLKRFNFDIYVKVNFRTFCKHLSCRS